MLEKEMWMERARIKIMSSAQLLHAFLKHDSVKETNVD